MEHLQSVSFLMGLVVLDLGALSIDVVRVRRGRLMVLKCEADPGDSLLSFTWKLHLYNSSCVISYKIEKDNTKTSYSSCSARMRNDHLSLTINNTEISDEGTYTCEVVNDKGTFIRTSFLQVLDVATTRKGRTAHLKCEVDPGDTLLAVTWKLRLYNSSCVLSNKTEKNNTTTSYSSCSPRMRSNHSSLTISNTEIYDEGMYICEVVNHKGTFIRYTLLNVLAEPSIFLKLNNDGSPECGAIGGNPPAEISWIPHSDDINNTVLKDLGQMGAVISTFSREGTNETSVTCVVSHPSFINPWKGDITLGGYKLRFDNIVRLIITVIFTVLLAGLFISLKIKRQVQNLPEEQINKD
ncbi:cell surface glycoprotein CD200 receptor 1-like isoform X2 [Phyllobates terribilis]|uniref:cell surface glycoprotein CD200 receptor 1-like isoform X2 n=1 Tax=Phyllobates terribilis TaxID=111132 RepID=UPI003CCA8CB8